MEFIKLKIDKDKLINESFFRMDYIIKSDAVKEVNVKVTIYDPFFNVKYTPGEEIFIMPTNTSYFVGFEIDRWQNDEKPNLKNGVRVVVENNDTGELLYEELYKTNHIIKRPTEEKMMWIIGDSHVWASFGDIHHKPTDIGGYYPIRISITSLSLNKFVSGDYVSLLKSLPIEAGDSLSFLFGEIDLRYSMHRHAIKIGKTSEEVCSDLVNRYFECIKNIKNQYDNRIIILSPNPPMRVGYLEGDFLATEEIRKNCWNTFNDFWVNKTKNLDYIERGTKVFAEYIDWTEKYKLSDGMINTETLSEKNHHIKKYDNFIEFVSNRVKLNEHKKEVMEIKDEAKELVDYCLNAELMDKCIFMQVYEEVLNLSYWMKGFKPHNILEIGTMGSTFWIMSKLSTGKKVSIDIEPRESIIHHFMYGEDWRFFQGNSQTDEMFNKVKNFCPQFDFIFIDGDHTYDGVRKDFEIYKKLLSPRGVICFHDIDLNHIFADSYAGQVYKFWEELDEGTKTNLVCTKSSGKVKLNGVHTQGFGGIGIWRP